MQKFGIEPNNNDSSGCTILCYFHIEAVLHYYVHVIFHDGTFEVFGVLVAPFEFSEALIGGNLLVHSSNLRVCDKLALVR